MIFNILETSWQGVFISFFIGSVSFAAFIAKLKGVDLRSQGSGNLGATNVGRVIGKKWGVAVFILDFLKGVLPVQIMFWMGFEPGWYAAMFGVFAILGHIYSPFLRFKGGKGVATGLGVVCVLMPQIFMIILGVVIVLFWKTRTISIVSITGAALLPILMWFFEVHQAYQILFSVVSVLIVWKHRENIKRLIKGEENKF